MPTYEYRCLSCRYQFEAFQRISEAPLSRCPQCEKPVERLISAGLSVIFKGSGFYSTDNKKSSPASKLPGSSSGKESAARTKKESAPEKTGEPQKVPT